MAVNGHSKKERESRTAFPFCLEQCPATLQTDTHCRRVEKYRRPFGDSGRDLVDSDSYAAGRCDFVFCNRPTCELFGRALYLAGEKQRVTQLWYVAVGNEHESGSGSIFIVLPSRGGALVDDLPLGKFAHARSYSVFDACFRLLDVRTDL